MRVLAIISIVLLFSQCTRKGCIDGDCINGFGTFLYSNGGTDKGNWQNGKMNGYGYQIQGKGKFEGDAYEGYFSNGFYNGKGTYIYPKYDSKLIGDFKDGKPNGFCTVFFGTNSTWKGTYSGYWDNGYNKEFEDFLKTSKNGEKVVFTSVVFFDTISYYFKYSDIQSIIDRVKKIHKRDLTKESVSFAELSELIDSLHSMQNKLDYSLEIIKSFKEFDLTINYKKATFDYLSAYKIGFDKEFLNWILIIQHNPDKYKPSMINDNSKPFVDRVKIQETIWKKAKNNFLDKYKLR